MKEIDDHPHFGMIGLERQPMRLRGRVDDVRFGLAECLDPDDHPVLGLASA